jgi:hypothetical protein
MFSSMHLDTIRRRYFAGRLVLFTGAGVAQAGGLPSWPSLIRAVLAYARADRPAPETILVLDRAADLLTRGELILAISELHMAMTSAAYGQAVTRALDDGAFEVPALAQAIAALAPTLRAVVTTNLDRFLERAFAGAWPVYTLAQLDLAQREHTILKLHGCLNDRNSWVLTRSEYDKVLHDRPKLREHLRSLYRSETLLFVGYGLQDPDLDWYLGELRAYADGAPPQHFALMPRGQVEEGHRRQLFAAAGINILEYDPVDHHRELLDILGTLAAAQPTAAIEPPPVRVRSQWASRSEPPPPPTRVLLVAANPADTDRLRLDAELAVIEEALRGSEHRDALHLSSAWAVDFTRLLDAMLRYAPHIIHFCGHGSDGELHIEGGAWASATLRPEVLAGMLAELPDLRCLVLNACESVERVDMLLLHVPCVIAMHGPVPDAGAQAFAAALYRALGYGRSVASAFRLACLALTHVRPMSRDIPRLHTADGVDPERLHLVRTSGPR